MLDQYGRKINYLRVSVTDRCNLRCRYCMPDSIAWERHEDILRYEEIIRICRAAVGLGITRFKITGGEPLVRRGCIDFIAQLKGTPGVEQVTMTTNGLLLGKHLDALCKAGLDGVNISLDTLDEARFRDITGCGSMAPEEYMTLLESCCNRGIRTKLNVVLLSANREDALSLATIAERLPVDVRFIELMPIGYGGAMERVDPDDVLRELQGQWPDLHPTQEKRGNGPAHYYASEALLGCIGFIDAVSHRFCESCNRVRVTSTGQLKPCLCFDSTLDLRAMLRSDCTEEALIEALQKAIFEKPRAHCFDVRERMTEHRMMSEIGG